MDNVSRSATTKNTGGAVNLKTDNEPFYDFSREVIKENNLQELDATNDLYANVGLRDEALTTIKTHYEKLFSDKGFKICYLKYII